MDIKNIIKNIVLYTVVKNENKIMGWTKTKKYFLGKDVNDLNEMEQKFYQNMLEEEYVLSIVRKYDNKSTLGSVQKNVEILRTHYNELQQSQQINMDIVDEYINSYSPQEIDKNMCRTGANLSVDKMVAYIDEYYDKFNPDYPNWTDIGGDCANYISQVLHAGGLPMVGVGKNSMDFENWFSQGNKTDIKKVSSTWRGADAFKYYFLENSNEHMKFNLIDDKVKYYDYGEVGDPLSILNPNGKAIHTMIVYRKLEKELILSAHTFATKSATFSEKANLFGGGAIIYKL